ncbi:MAG TPA: hypothetical protein VFC39_10485 [Acidobacteriaceae bacterium]|nr:hypothetical protein [Acidobacteriaceae bacterium]
MKFLPKVLVVGALASLTLGAAPQAGPRKGNETPIVHLQGDTRACLGHFDLTRSTMRWTSTWSRCTTRSPHLLSTGANSWTLKMTSAKGCGYEVVTLVNLTERDQLPKTEYPLWIVDGFTTLRGYRQHPETPDISCNMQ